MGAQRHAKNIGQFARLLLRDGKPQYLKHIPHMWGLLDADLAPSRAWRRCANGSMRTCRRDGAACPSGRPHERCRETAMIMAAGLAHAHAADHRDHAQGADRGRRQAASSTTPSTGSRRSASSASWSTPHYKADMLAAHLAGAPRRGDRAVAGAGAARQRRRHFPSAAAARRHLLCRQRRRVLARRHDAGAGRAWRAAFDRRHAWTDCCCCSAPSPRSGSTGRAISWSIRSGSCAGARRPRSRPISSPRIQALHRRFFDGAPGGKFSLRPYWTRAIEAGRLYGIVHDGEWYHLDTPRGLAPGRTPPRLARASSAERDGAFYTIPAELPFLDALVAGILPRAGDDPLALTRTTILLPTRRAVRSLTEAFLRASAGRALLLPRLVPVGDLDAEELAIIGRRTAAIDIPPAAAAAAAPTAAGAAGADVAAPGRPGVDAGAGGAAGARARRFPRHGADRARAISGARRTRAGQFAAHWQQVLIFLGIVTDDWPAILAAHGALDPAERRNRVLAARIAAWETAPPREPVIAAGLTGGIAAVGDLIAAVARLPRGDIVLAGLDLDRPSHGRGRRRSDPPAASSCRGCWRGSAWCRNAIPPWPGCAMAARVAAPRPGPRRAGARSRNRPLARATKLGATAIADLRRLDCAGAQEEAEIIALLMRQALEKPGQTAALVTPDRALARRVAAELKRWNIEIDDSAGVPLDQTPPAVFLRLVLDAAGAALAPLPLLALLKHPLAAGGMRAGDVPRAGAAAGGASCLRGPRPAPGLPACAVALPPGERELADLVSRLDAALRPLIARARSARDQPRRSRRGACRRRRSCWRASHDDERRRPAVARGGGRDRGAVHRRARCRGGDVSAAAPAATIRRCSKR